MQSQSQGKTSIRLLISQFQKRTLEPVTTRVSASAIIFISASILFSTLHRRIRVAVNTGVATAAWGLGVSLIPLEFIGPAIKVSTTARWHPR